MAKRKAKDEETKTDDAPVVENEQSEETKPKDKEVEFPDGDIKASVFCEVAQDAKVINKYQATLLLQPEFQGKVKTAEEWKEVLEEVMKRPITK